MITANKTVILCVGISVIGLSACSPRQSVTQSASNQSMMQPTGINNQPLYQTQTSPIVSSQQLATTMSPIVATNPLTAIDNTATGTISKNTTSYASYPPAEIPPVNNYQSQSETAYIVQAGDTIYSIGRKFNVNPTEIISKNQMLNPNQLVVGQKFMIPTNGNYTQAQPTQQSVPTYPQVNYANNNTIPATNQNYTVQAGDTIYSIGRKFNINPNYIIQKNPTINHNQLALGQVLNISANTNNFSTEVTNSIPSNNTNNVMGANQNAIKQNTSSNILSLPVQGSIKQNKELRGILITANDGDAVKASATGEVIYVGNLNNYGNMVLVRHDNGLVTNYARLKRTFVQKGQHVSKGDLIATAGASQEFNTSDVLFEVRQGTKAVNPLDYVS